MTHASISDSFSLSGTTSDPNQANRTGLPEKSARNPEAEKKAKSNEGQPGTTDDPNQANRT